VSDVKYTYEEPESDVFSASAQFWAIEEMLAVPSHDFR
jgi:hypothetical protein